MSDSDSRSGPAYLIVGTRPNGEQLVIDQAATLARAERLHRTYASMLEGYREIAVERVTGELQESDDD